MYKILTDFFHWTGVVTPFLFFRFSLWVVGRVTPSAFFLGEFTCSNIEKLAKRFSFAR